MEKIKGNRVVILAEIGCGKDYALQQIINNFDLRKVVTHTTRPIRNGEINGENYVFISQDEFKSNIEKGFYLEYKEYKVAGGEIWYYGTPKEEVDKDNTIIILDKEGFIEYNKRVENISIFISVWDETERFYKSLKRLKKCSMIDVDEVYRRIRHDASKFEDIHGLVDCVIPQFYNNETINLIFKFLEENNIRRVVKNV